MFWVEEEVEEVFSFEEVLENFGEEGCFFKLLDFGGWGLEDDFLRGVFRCGSICLGRFSILCNVGYVGWMDCFKVWWNGVFVFFFF